MLLKTIALLDCLRVFWTRTGHTGHWSLLVLSFFCFWLRVLDRAAHTVRFSVHVDLSLSLSLSDVDDDTW